MHSSEAANLTYQQAMPIFSFYRVRMEVNEQYVFKSFMVKPSGNYLYYDFPLNECSSFIHFYSLMISKNGKFSLILVPLTRQIIDINETKKAKPRFILENTSYLVCTNIS